MSLALASAMPALAREDALCPSGWNSPPRGTAAHASPGRAGRRGRAQTAYAQSPTPPRAGTSAGPYPYPCCNYDPNAIKPDRW